MIIVTRDVIKNLKPCVNRYANFILYYKDFEGSIIEFLKLNKITYSDKIWVCIQLIPIEFLKDWAILCAESVLSYYEQSPNDLTIREQLVLLKTHRTLSHNQLSEIRDIIENKRNIAYVAYTYADDDDTWRGWRAAAAAAVAAVAAYNNAHASINAAYTAAAAADAVDADADARQKQQQINLDLLREVLESNNDC